MSKSPSSLWPWPCTAFSSASSMSDLDAPTCKHSTTAVRVQNQHLCTALALSNLFLFVTHVALKSFLPTYVQLEHLPDDQLQDVSPDGRQVGGHPQEVVRVAFLRRGDELRLNRCVWVAVAAPEFCFGSYFTRLLEDFWTKGKFSCRMGIRKRLVLKADGENQKQNKITALRVLTRVILSGAVRVKDKIWKKINT